VTIGQPSSQQKKNGRDQAGLLLVSGVGALPTEHHHHLIKIKILLKA
jgi:hypothetical protein